MGFSWRKTFKIKQTRKSKGLSAFDVEHAQCLTGYHVFMVSGLDLARAPRRRPLTARKKGSGYENDFFSAWHGEARETAELVYILCGADNPKSWIIMRNFRLIPVL